MLIQMLVLQVRSGNIASLFPEGDRSISKEVEDEANSYFQRIYKVGFLTRFKTKSSPRIVVDTVIIIKLMNLVLCLGSAAPNTNNRRGVGATPKVPDKRCAEGDRCILLYDQEPV